jgi:hypothetical protein
MSHLPNNVIAGTQVVSLVEARGTNNSVGASSRRNKHEARNVNESLEISLRLRPFLSHPSCHYWPVEKMTNETRHARIIATCKKSGGSVICGRIHA